MLDFDTMLMHVGEFGLYQKILFAFQAPFCMFVTFVLFGQMFMVLYPVNYWCESHFACLHPDSQVTPAQRRNISFVWKNGGLFRTDPCHLNDINDGFLRFLNDWDKRTCARSKQRICEYKDNNAQSQGQGPFTAWTSRPPSTKPDYPPPPPRIQVLKDEKNAEDRTVRKKRHYASFDARARSQIPTFPTTSTTESSFSRTEEYPSERQQGNGAGQFGRDYYGGSRYGQPDRGGSQGQNSFPSRPVTDNNPTGRDSNYDNYDSPWTSTQYPGQYPADKPNQAGLSGNKKPSNSLTPLNAADGGWPQPTCNKTRFLMILGNNTVILADKMQRQFENNKLKEKRQATKNCKIRWDRNDLPYETIVSEGDWWCNAELYTTIAQAVFFLGAIVGGFLIGWIADTFGRVPALVIANILGALGGALSIVSTDIRVFSVFRFITGMAFDNCFTMMYILVLEFCGPSYRTLVANLSIAVFYTLGTLILPLLAWLIGNWKIYALVISLPMLLGLLALFFVPESARWLLSKGRAKEATNILRSFAKVNRRKVDEKVFVDFEQEATQLFSELEQTEEEPSLAAAFRTPRLRMTFILLIIFWSLIALVYDGHSRNIINLANEDLNVFWMFGIASMTEFPADMLLIFTLDRFGRRWLAFGSMTLSGAFSFISAAVTPEMRTGYLITAIISRFWVNVAFNIGLQYAAELLPTVIRAQGVNAIHIMGYVASIISPFVAAIGRTNPTLSLTLLGAFAITAGFVSLFLAETLGEDLPNTLEEAEAFGKNQSFWNCPICAKERDDYPTEPPPAAMEERPVVMRNAMRGSIRGEFYRSSMISHASSGGSRRSRYLHGDRVHNAPEPTELTKLRRVTH